MWGGWGVLGPSMIPFFVLRFFTSPFTIMRISKLVSSVVSAVGCNTEGDCFNSCLCHFVTLLQPPCPLWQLNMKVV